MAGEEQQQTNKNPISSAYRAFDQNFLYGYAPGGAKPAHRQVIDTFNQGREISANNGGGGWRQAGRGAVNLMDNYLLAGTWPGGIKPSQVFNGQKPGDTLGDPRNQTKPAESEGNKPGFIDRGYNALDRMAGNRLPWGVPYQSGKNPQTPQLPDQNPIPAFNGWQVPNYSGPPSNNNQPAQQPQQQPWGSLPDYTAQTPASNQQPPQTGKNPAQMNNQPDRNSGSTGQNGDMFNTRQPITTAGGGFNADLARTMEAIRANSINANLIR